jgi:hypothetical protein
MSFALRGRLGLGAEGKDEEKKEAVPYEPRDRGQGSPMKIQSIGENPQEERKAGDEGNQPDVRDSAAQREGNAEKKDDEAKDKEKKKEKEEGKEEEKGKVVEKMAFKSYADDVEVYSSSYYPFEERAHDEVGLADGIRATGLFGLGTVDLSAEKAAKLHKGTEEAIPGDMLEKMVIVATKPVEAGRTAGGGKRWGEHQ